jgi:DNA-binding response OmpR family regulator
MARIRVEPNTAGRQPLYHHASKNIPHEANRSILYVEDEIFLAKIVSETLQGRGYEVVLESDGGKALQRFEEVQARHVCLLDIMLPNKDGFDIADSIRERNTDVPIIFLSAKSESGTMSSTASRWAATIISASPSAWRSSLPASKMYCAIHAGADGRGSRARQYAFNPKRQTLVSPRRNRKLSYRESELLRTLYQNRNDVVERRDILNLLWGSDSFFNSRNLDVYITKLRNYLKGDPRIEIITIKGIGYRFVIN